MTKLPSNNTWVTDACAAALLRRASFGAAHADVSWHAETTR
jgi:hypothetical protein